MKNYTMICFFLALGMIVFPLVSLDNTSDVLSQEFSGETVITKTENVTVESIPTVKVMSANSDDITEMPLKEYLIGVVAEEMNASYHEEAIKAQIVASHTLLLYIKNKNSDSLNGADISGDSGTHQGFLTKEKQQEKWKDNYNANYEKIAKCVDEVMNYSLQYNGEYINAAFHSISNGNTENAKDVWGGNYPYLVSVTSIGDKLSPAYQSEVKISKDEFKKAFKKENVSFDDKPENWVKKITNTKTGMVKTIEICDKTFTGREIRSLFSLRSSTFTCEYKDGNFIFTVNGYGHGVGMSQYGANYMAQQGFTYEEILKHYYKGVEIV
jgi:stage II sporulation protein D